MLSAELSPLLIDRAQQRGGRNVTADDDRSRDIHNEICDGHMPAFLVNPPSAKAEAKPAAKKAPAKRRPRKKAPAKTDASKAPTAEE